MCAQPGGFRTPRELFGGNYLLQQIIIPGGLPGLEKWLSGTPTKLQRVTMDLQYSKQLKKTSSILIIGCVHVANKVI